MNVVVNLKIMDFVQKECGGKLERDGFCSFSSFFFERYASWVKILRSCLPLEYVTYGVELWNMGVRKKKSIYIRAS